jgi:hypothetical protein
MIPTDIAERAARFWFGDEGTITPNATQEVRSMDGGSYTLRGTRIAGPYGERALIYVFDEGYVIEFYDMSGGRISRRDDGRYEFRGTYGQLPQTF